MYMSTFAEMDAAKKRAYIKQQAAMKKRAEGQTPKGTGSKPSTKRKQLEKSDRLPKKPKNVLEPVVGLEAKPKKTTITLGHGKGKGLMKGPTPIAEKPPVLLHEDPKHALEKFSSIITSDDYEDLSDSTKAIRETGLFSIAQVTASVHSLYIFYVAMFSNSASLSGSVNDERANGSLPEP